MVLGSPGKYRGSQADGRGLVKEHMLEFHPRFASLLDRRFESRLLRYIHPDISLM